MVATGASERPLRADAVRNRAKILAAAQEVFAERGLDVTLDDIARHAGLGVGTVYRRFADRETLIEALFEERMRKHLTRMKASLQAPDAWSALISEIRHVCEEMAVDRGLRQVMLSSIHGHDRLVSCRIELRDTVSCLVRRAKETGRLRADFEAADMPILFVMVGAVVDFAGGVRPDVWRRYLDVLLEGLRAPTESDVSAGDPLSSGASASALSDEELLASMDAWRPLTLR